MDGASREAAGRDGAAGRALIAGRAFRTIGQITTICITILCASIVVTSKPADPALWPARDGEQTIPVVVVSNGFHAGIVIPRLALENAARRDGRAAVLTVAERFGAYRFLEFGWGEEEFYRATPTLKSIDPHLAARALFWPWTRSVVHIVGFDDPPEQYFPNAERFAIETSEEGFARLVATLDQRFRRDANGKVNDAGKGLYGPSLFYPATGHFSIISNCNRWVGDLVAAAGLPSSTVLSLVSPIFVRSLRYAMERVQAR